MEQERRIILWDLDGTLTESGPGITNSVRYALSQMGIEESDPAKLDRFVGPPLWDSFRGFYGMSEEEAERAVELYRVYFRRQGMFENSVYEGIPEALAALKGAGYVLAVATSKPEVFAKKITDHFHLTEYFTLIGGSSMDASRSHKADVIRYVLELLGAAPGADDILMVGDRENDVTGAAQNGLPCLGVLFGYGSREELEMAGAAVLCERAQDLPAAIDAFFAARRSGPDSARMI